jgi:hypothetical protein
MGWYRAPAATHLLQQRPEMIGFGRILQFEALKRSSAFGDENLAAFEANQQRAGDGMPVWCGSVDGGCSDARLRDRRKQRTDPEAGGEPVHPNEPRFHSHPLALQHVLFVAAR